jgi:hypothetical protein
MCCPSTASELLVLEQKGLCWCCLLCSHSELGWRIWYSHRHLLCQQLVGYSWASWRVCVRGSSV